MVPAFHTLWTVYKNVSGALQLCNTILTDNALLYPATRV
jgi:hypothetical protein